MQNLGKSRKSSLWAAMLVGSVWIPSGTAIAGIQGAVHVHNQTDLIIEIQVNGRYRAVIDPGDTGRYWVGDTAEEVTELCTTELAVDY